MTIRTTVAQAQAALTTRIARLNSGTIQIRSGTRPATPETAVTGVLLATLTFGATAFGAPASSGGNAVSTANAITSGTAVATGTASWFRIYQSDGTTPEIDGDLGTTGSDINLPTLSITTGVIVGVSSYTLTEPTLGV